MTLDTSPFDGAGLLDLPGFFAGRASAWGMVQDRFGKVRRRFVVSIVGEWDGSDFRLDETFRFDDGVEEKRVWIIREATDGRFTATAEDVVGIARGRQDGATLRIAYKLRLTIRGRSFVATFDDRMVLIDRDTMLNRARMSKWGLHLGDVTIFFRRESLSQQPPPGA